MGGEGEGERRGRRGRVGEEERGEEGREERGRRGRARRFFLIFFLCRGEGSLEGWTHWSERSECMFPILCNVEISPLCKILRESDTIPPIPTTPGQINVELRFVVQSIFLRSICSPFVMQSVFAQTTFVFACMPCCLEGA